MDSKSIIKQLEKALEKDDKELRLRVEVLVDMIKESQPISPNIPPISPLSPPNVPQWPRVPEPTVTYESDTVSDTVGQSVAEAKKKPIKEGNPGNVRGSGGIVSNGEQITYSRPKGT